MAMIHLEPQTAQMFSRALGALKPPPNLTLSQWADNYRRLSAEASAAQGRWNTDNAPFQREIMDAIGDVHIRKVVAMMCAQSGKTDGLILNTIGYYMSYYPAPIMIVQPMIDFSSTVVELSGDSEKQKEVQDIAKCLRTLYSTPIGSQEGDRELGINPNIFVDKPLPVAKGLYVAEVTEKTASFEPRARVVRVDWLDSDVLHGVVIPKVVYELV